MPSALSEIERDLKELLLTDRRAWVKSFRMMERVRCEELWRPGYRSFSSWLFEISVRAKIHVSVLWERLQAGEFWLLYEKEERKNGRSVPPLEKARIGVEKLKYIFRLSSGSPVRARPLIEQARSGLLTGASLRQSWKTEKAERIARGEKVSFANGYERDQFYAELNSSKDSASDCIPSIAELLMALTQTAGWLPGATLKPWYADSYEVFPEFEIPLGSRTVRMDALLAESLTARTTGKITLHGFVIRNAEESIKSLPLQPLSDFTDCLWVLAPSSAARALDMEDGVFGILEYTEDKELQVLRAPKKNTPLKRALSLEALALRTVKKVRDISRAGQN